MAAIQLSRHYKKIHSTSRKSSAVSKRNFLTTRPWTLWTQLFLKSLSSLDERLYATSVGDFWDRAASYRVVKGGVSWWIGNILSGGRGFLRGRGWKGVINDPARGSHVHYTVETMCNLPTNIFRLGLSADDVISSLFWTFLSLPAIKDDVSDYGRCPRIVLFTVTYN